MIDVSAHGVDRRQRAEPRKYVRGANIPGMDDGIAAGKRRERLRPQQAMGIGNRANGSHHARPAYKMSRVRREPRSPRRFGGAAIFVYLLSRTFFPMAVRTYSSC